MKSPAAKIIFFILSIISLGAISFFLFLFSLFGMNLSYWLVLLPVVMLIRLLYVFFWDRLFLKKEKIRFCLFFILPCFLLAGFSFYQEQDDEIPILTEQLEILSYQPFEEGKPNPALPHLDSPSTLSLSENLPRIDCATALYPIAAAFVEAAYPSTLEYFPYQDPPPVLQVNKTPDAYENLINRKVDLIFAAGPSAQQINRAKEKGVEFILTPIGKEGFVFFVNAKNPIENLTVDEIQKIYSGQITNWKLLGGNDQKIRAFQRDENSGSQTALQKLMNGHELVTPPQEDRVQGMDGIIRATARYKNYDSALGFSFRFYSTEMVKDQQIKLLKINNVAPTEENIRNGSYPLTADFYAITLKENANPNTQALLEWILSPQGQELIQRTGYTPLLSY